MTALRSTAAASVIATAKDRFEVEATATTLKQTTLGTLKPGTRLNLERALRVGDRLGGHIITGHIDEIGRVRRRLCTAGETRLVITIQPANSCLIVPKGSVAIDGVSLTVQEAGKDHFTVNLIPYTLEKTTLKELRPGTQVNIEYDLIVKSARTGIRTPALPV